MELSSVLSETMYVVALTLSDIRKRAKYAKKQAIRMP
jgi:hypothetical protein